ncbi:MAG: hypothetical protein V1698_00835 [bacterium]
MQPEEVNNLKKKERKNLMENSKKALKEKAKELSEQATKEWLPVYDLFLCGDSQDRIKEELAILNCEITREKNESGIYYWAVRKLL